MTAHDIIRPPMPTLMQKIRLVLRGWSRRREEKQHAFLSQNAGWGAALTPQAMRPPSEGPLDLEGLTVAYLDDSGQFHYYLDVETGEVVEARAPLAGARYRRVPSRDAQSDLEDRRAFVELLDASDARERLTACVGVPEAFRRVLAADRKIERAWYNFRNDRAIAVIRRWL
ncbi:MAG TPA: hypothetical protein VKH35_10950 [Thermoanaerobaculia bacterium]|nr:hypothetical protein [Thermoanaerobaculia bacterium]